MNFINRAWQFTFAKKGRTGVLILVFTAILVFVMAGLTIQSATNTASENAKKSVGATVTLSVNREKMMGSMQRGDSGEVSKIEIPTIPASSVEKIAKMSEVKSSIWQTTASASATDSFHALKSSDDNDDSENSNGGPRMMISQGGQNMADVDFNVTGVNDMSGIGNFSDGTDKLLEGRLIDEQDKDTNHVVIEETLAKLNDVKVGDKIKVKNSDSKEVELEIIGIYQSGEETNDMMMRIPSMNPVNKIYAYYTEANTLGGKEKDTISTAIFNLNDPKEMADFVKKAEKNIDTEKFQLQTNDSMYQEMLSPLNNVASFSKNIVLLVAIAGAIILTLIIVLQVRERKFEIGVLMSLGENKTKIIGQFFAELFIVMALSAGLAGVFGNIVGNAVGQQLLTQQNAVAEEEKDSNSPGQGAPGPGGGMMRTMGGGSPFGIGQSQQDIEQIKELHVKTTPETFGILIAIAIGITVLAIMLASIGILRMQPKDILTNS